MYDIHSWITFFGAPLFLLFVTAYVFRPSAREHYREAKRVIFSEQGQSTRRKRSQSYRRRRG